MSQENVEPDTAGRRVEPLVGRCADCRFWRCAVPSRPAAMNQDFDRDQGFCVIRAPQIYAEVNLRELQMVENDVEDEPDFVASWDKIIAERGRWPWTYDDDYCGEFVSR